MQKIILSVCAMGLFLSIQSCKQNNNTTDDGLASFNKDSMLVHIKMLASDSFQGRRPFSLGEKRTIDYLQNQFKQMDIEAGNGASYI